MLQEEHNSESLSLEELAQFLGEVYQILGSVSLLDILIDIHNHLYEVIIVDEVLSTFWEVSHQPIDVLHIESQPALHKHSLKVGCVKCALLVLVEELKLVLHAIHPALIEQFIPQLVQEVLEPTSVVHLVAFFDSVEHAH